MTDEKNELPGPGKRPLVSLVGRPNVGKSTLFNRMAKKRLSLAHQTPGLTRDRIYAEANINGVVCEVIDTAGLDTKNERELSEAMKQQTEIAIAQSDLVIFVVDGLFGIEQDDRIVAQMLRESGKPVILAVNKAETKAVQESAFDFFALGFDDLIPISGAHGFGIETLYENIAARFENLGSTASVVEPEICVAILGKPNAGKSSFLNRLLSEERHLVSEIPGTTTDAVDSHIEYAGKRFKLIDTAGVRRKRSIFEETEKMSVSATLCALDRADIAILMLDATEPVSEQDQKIAGFIEDKSKGAVIVVNKWDLSKANDLKSDVVVQGVRDKLQFLAHAPVRLVSAKTGSRVFDVLDEIVQLHEEYHRRVPTSQVNKVLERAQALHAAPVAKGRRVKFFYGTQVKAAPPTFLVACNAPTDVHFSYRRFLVNQIREAFGFKGVPVKLLLRGRGGKEE
jgi:GTP-binding protein